MSNHHIVINRIDRFLMDESKVPNDFHYQAACSCSWEQAWSVEHAAEAIEEARTHGLRAMLQADLPFTITMRTDFPWKTDAYPGDFPC